MSKLTEILHELAAVTGRHNLHPVIDDLVKDAPAVEETVKDAETLTEGGK